jgi:hypothetical protein
VSESEKIIHFDGREITLCFLFFVLVFSEFGEVEDNAKYSY